MNREGAERTSEGLRSSLEVVTCDLWGLPCEHAARAVAFRETLRFLAAPGSVPAASLVTAKGEGFYHCGGTLAGGRSGAEFAQHEGPAMRLDYGPRHVSWKI